MPSAPCKKRTGTQRQHIANDQHVGLGSTSRDYVNGGFHVHEKVSYNQSLLPRWLVGLILIIPLLITGCGILAVKPEHRELDATLIPEHYAVADSASNTVKRVELPARWWEIFESSELNLLIEQAFSNNLDIAAAVTRLRQAHEQMIIAGAAGRFELSGTGSAGVNKFGNTTSGISVDGTQESYGVDLRASYLVDIWGAVVSEERAAELVFNAGAEQLEAVALLISGAITTAWVQYKTVLAEKNLIAQQIATSRQALEILKVRQRAALSAAVDVYQQESQVAALERLLPQLDERCSDLRIEINYLLGAPASAALPVEISDSALPTVDYAVDYRVPVDLLSARPDVRAAWQSLRSSEWVVAARQADRLPTLTLSGSLSMESEEFSDLLKNWYLNLAAGLLAPMIDGGRRVARVRLAEAQADESFIAYTDTVLRAMREVEQALARDQTRRAYLAAVEREIELNARTLTESNNRYRKGLMEYLNVLTALSAKQSSERRALEARSSLVLNRINLYQALGGRVLRGNEDE